MGDGPEGVVRRPKRATWRVALFLGGAALIVLIAGFGILGLWQGADAGRAGKAELVQAEHDLLGQRVRAAGLDLRRAAEDFRKMDRDLHRTGVAQALAVWRLVPLVRLQVRAVSTFADIGASMSRAGERVTDAGAPLEEPSGHVVVLSNSLGELRALEAAVGASARVADRATDRLDELKGYRLLGPVGRARDDLSRHIRRVDRLARSADQGLTALITFVGGNGPRRYLLLSQNPDEVRPTGGFMGSYGTLTANDGKLSVGPFDNTNIWIAAHPDAILPANQATSPFRLYDPPLAQTLSNVNTVPDWPQVAQQILKLWQQGREQSMDGVVSFTPDVLARILAVTGPVSVPSFGEIVTAANVKSRIDYYTHVLIYKNEADRKEFLSPLGQAVMAKLVTTPATQWRALANSLYQAFTVREVLVWSSDEPVQSSLVSRGWDGRLPPGAGDFLFDGEVEYVAKNGGGLKRTFDHHVVLHSDGSAQVTTNLTIRNTEGPGVQNDNPLTYFTFYGPMGATLDPASDPPFTTEPSIAGHPASGWFRSVLPNDSATINVVWDMPDAGQPLSDGSWRYTLRFLHLVDNPGDTLHLTVDLPPRGRWVSPPPPSQATLGSDVAGTWSYRLAS